MPLDDANEHDRETELHHELIASVLEAYPDKAKKKRAKHLNTSELGKSDCGVKANVKSIPGVMTVRGCAYAGSKGVVWGPVKDVLHISHGPVGCGQYSWAQRRNYATGLTGVDNFVTMQITSDFQERDIVFGGDKKLRQIVDELNELFPLARGVSVQSECPIGLIGDDIEAVSRDKAKDIGKPVIPVRCEGFRGVSQSLGHHIANDAIRDWVLNRESADDGFEPGPYDVTVIGDYNIGGDAWSSRILLEELGQPSSLRKEAPAEVWQYRAELCVLDIVLYEASDGPSVVYLEARDLYAEPAETAPCLSHLLDLAAVSDS